MKTQLLALLALIPTLALAQAPRTDTTYWTTKHAFALTMNQATFSDNWKAGGINSISLNMLFTGSQAYQHGRWRFTNSTDLQFGLVKNQDQDTRKSNDRIFEDLMAGYNLGKNWSAVASVNFITQFAPGYQYAADDPRGERKVRLSDFMAPAYLTEGLGFEYKPGDSFFARISPVGLRHTFVLDTTLYRTVPENFGVERGKRSRTQAVFQLLLNYEKTIMENTLLKLRYLGSADYGRLEAQGLVHRLDLTLTAKVNKYISTSFTSNLLYDFDQDANLQYSHLLGLGFQVTF